MNLSLKLKRAARRTEFYIFICLMVLLLAVQLRSGQLSAYYIVNVLRSMVVPGMFGLTTLMVIISGGFDLSFPALAALSYSATATLLESMDYKGNLILAFVIAAAIGAVCGCLNGWIISNFKLPTMIVTLATSSVFMGLMLGILLLKEITSTLPTPFAQFGRAFVFTVYDPTGRLRSNLPVSFLLLVALAIGVSLTLKYTKLGRAFYAIGGNETSAERAGFYVKRTKFQLYVVVGVLSAITGVVRCCMAEQAIPAALVGMDMKVLPAVILGGASIFGGEGTVTGTLLAIALIQTMENSMLLLGIPTIWSSFFTGLVILAGVSIAAIQVRRTSNV